MNQEAQAISTVEKGDKLEDAFYDYLQNQKSKGELVYGLYPSKLCKIYKKKKLFCHDRQKPVEFDVVIELKRENDNTPSLLVIFECKNHSRSVPESVVRTFSDTLNSTAPHNSKGVLVVGSRLQSGAFDLAKKRGIGLIVYDESNFKTVLNRKGKIWAEESFLKEQMTEGSDARKALRFSAYYNGKFINSIADLLQHLDDSTGEPPQASPLETTASIPYLNYEEAEEKTSKLLNDINYNGGLVDLNAVCSYLEIDLKDIDERHPTDTYHEILGTADFEKREIIIYPHVNMNRERFTICHEIGHFYLKHDQYLTSEAVTKNNLVIREDSDNKLTRLEYQANIFASALLLPRDHFIEKTEEIRQALGIKDKGHGYIYVDKQTCNRNDYYFLKSRLSAYFGTSKQAIEIKFKNLGLLNDNR